MAVFGDCSFVAIFCCDSEKKAVADVQCVDWPLSVAFGCSSGHNLLESSVECSLIVATGDGKVQLIEVIASECDEKC